ncbi:unnamed protein product [Cylindrotheca closterium]|uniref:Thiol-disulfide oxidoreductase DCC n=1 Tax=Cylindrotheca closterium TaxID=2856 RepID=A0AAD2CVX0_9STRA|nr:unnamed protein product [Cylindrotheca closterium]
MTGISHVSTLILCACILASFQLSTTNAWTTTSSSSSSSSHTLISARRQQQQQHSTLSLNVASPDMSSLSGSGSGSGSSASTASKSKTKSKSNSSSKADAAIVDWDWAAVAKDVFQEDSRPIVLFDGVCNLCNGGVNFAIDHDEDAKLRFTSLQSKVAQSLLLRSGMDPKEANIVLVTKNKAYFSSDAVSRICLQLDTDSLKLVGKMGMVTPNWIREALYKYVSSNRYFFGENDQCRIDFDGTYTSRFVSDPMTVGESSSSSSSSSPSS